MSVIDFEFINEKHRYKVSIDGVERTDVTYILPWDAKKNFGRLKKLSQFHWKLKIPKDKFGVSPYGILFFAEKKGMLFIDENH